MNWPALKYNRCPKCDYGLEQVIDMNPLYANCEVVMLICENPGLGQFSERCGFRIRESRAKEIMASNPSSFSRRNGVMDRNDELGNLHALNNL